MLLVPTLVLRCAQKGALTPCSLEAMKERLLDMDGNLVLLSESALHESVFSVHLILVADIPGKLRM